MNIWEYKDIEQDYLIPFVSECSRTINDVDLLLSLQSMYRQKIGWDRNTESILSAVGFLCGGEKELCHYLIEKIVNEKDGDAFKDSKYTYMYCLTIASLYSPIAIKQILVFFDAMKKCERINSSGKVNPSKSERKLRESLYPDAQRGFWDAKRSFYKNGFASEATIKGLIGLISTNSKRYDSGLAISILALFLGNNHIVKCVDSNSSFGTPIFIEKDFADYVIRMFRNNPPYYLGSSPVYGEYHQILESWCEHNPTFRTKLRDSIEYIKPILLSRYIKNHKRHLVYEREERTYDSLKKLRNYSDEEIEKKYASDEYLEFLDKCIRNLNSKENETRISEFTSWKDVAMKDPQSLAKDAMNFIDASIHEYPI